MDSENNIHNVDNDSEVKFPDIKDSEESRKVQSNSLENSSISTNVDSSSVTSNSSVISKDASHIVGFDNNFACESTQNEQANEPMELCTEDEIKITTDKCNKTNNVLKEILYATNFNSVDLSEATTSQDNSPSSSYTNEANALYTDQNKVKRSISKSQVHASSGTSIEKSDDSSDEDSSKRQKLNKSACNTSTGNVNDDTVTFQRNKSKVKQRNYRKRRNITSDNDDSSSNTLSNEVTREAPISDADEGNVASVSAKNDSAQNETNRNSETHRAGSETPNDESDRYKDERADSSEWRANEDEWDEEEEDEDEDEEVPHCLKIEKPPPNWRIVPEVINRQIGSNPLFQRRFYGSLHAVERLELMYNLNEHQGCVNALNFNQKGNLLASASDDLAVVIWDWAVGKKRHWFMSGHTSNMFQAKWLPLDVEYLMVTCARDGQVRLLDLEHDTSKKLATHRGPSHKLAVHPETPHVVFSAGEDARVFSIDIRESKPNKLLVVKEGSSEVQLFSIHSNPFNSNEFCVGGRSHYVRVYDRRKVSTPLYKLCPDHLTGNKHAHVTCAVYNHNGTEILASYNDEDIYLFDRLMSSHVDYAHKYQGHRNSATVKGVNFFGPKSEYVVSGSDCGNIFIWDKNTEAVVQWMTGDKQGVVNCLEGHPHIPILATSGLDYDVKIWVPSCGEPPVMKSFANCVKSNARNRKQENVPDSFDGQLLWILLRHIRHRERVRNLYTRYGLETPNRDEDDDDDDDYHFDDSSMDSSSEDSDNQSEGDVRRIQCPPS
ncbi:PREDICTED: DDB1- and CUL4-associated factor 8-like [Acromyrmex echinatior]|uniref:WD repeat-containing protein 42A n=1 Tax=Acromyrmex echinatior TaxID=103372 RepID=F4WAZ4_ACREC|nr:PREDICTED: DDB1- and CUL4-associated factor 8-like [Acromyrmex echinatior]XP_011049407.1 PREDICTED: DDB1- and CUL4-associated factor 8-like [Acromyrmex echinatior]EGI68614.1 WD repeat-containing protein 42A [Acromyrmex echinatior]